MTFLNNHIADVVFKGCPGERGIKMVIYTDIDPSPATDEGQRALVDLMREVEVHTRQYPEIQCVEVIKDRS